MEQKRTLPDWVTPPIAFAIMYTVIVFVRDVVMNTGILLAASVAIGVVSLGVLHIAQNYRSQALAILCLASWVTGIAAGILQS